MIGKTISHYKILEELGRGGMGVVYKATDLDLERAVAIKFLPPHLSTDPESTQRFINEAKTASAIDHQHIGTIYEIGRTDDGQTFIVMACYEGETLRERIDRGGMSMEEALDIATQVASGLAKAHDKDIVHRDIKPSNIIITKDTEAKIIDFGLAKLAGKTKLTKEGSTLGTAAYMSPEQARGEEVDHRSDIFSLGSILYEMLAGEPPFKGEHEAALLYGIVHEEPDPLTESVSVVHPGIQEVVDRALAKDPAERYQQVRELRADLLRLKGDTGRVSTASGSFVRTSRTSILKRASTYIGLVVVAAIVFSAIYFLIPRDQAQADRESIAVLPFKIIVTEPEYEWFGESMREAITGHLTKIKDLKVISNASSNKFRDSGLTPGEIAEELDVATILEASVQQTGGRILLMIKLIDARTDEYIWAGDYNRDLEDVFAVQADVALNVVGQLKATLTAEVEKRIEARPTDNIEAYKLLMQAREEWSSGDHDRRSKSLVLYKQAIDIDPDYADAYAQMSLTYFLLPFYGNQPPKDMVPMAKEYALKALEIDEGSILASNVLGMIKMMYDWDWEEVEKHYVRSIELNPGADGSYEDYAWYLMFTGRFDEMVEALGKSYELNPLGIGRQQNAGERLYYARRYDESMEASLKALDMNPNYVESKVYLGLAYIGKGMREEAVKVLLEVYGASSARSPEIEQMLGTAFAMADEYEKAREILDNLLKLSGERWTPPALIATLYIALGETDRGFQWLEKAFEENDMILPFIKVHPAYDKVSSDPRYLDMLKRIGLPD